MEEDAADKAINDKAHLSKDAKIHVPHESRVKQFQQLITDIVANVLGYVPDPTQVKEELRRLIVLHGFVKVTVLLQVTDLFEYISVHIDAAIYGGWGGLFRNSRDPERLKHEGSDGSDTYHHYRLSHHYSALNISCGWW